MRDRPPAAGALPRSACHRLGSAERDSGRHRECTPKILPVRAFGCSPACRPPLPRHSFALNRAPSNAGGRTESTGERATGHRYGVGRRLHRKLIGCSPSPQPAGALWLKIPLGQGPVGPVVLLPRGGGPPLFLFAVPLDQRRRSPVGTASAPPEKWLGIGPFWRPDTTTSHVRSDVTLT
jgi:hypothetical protein